MRNWLTCSEPWVSAYRLCNDTLIIGQVEQEVLRRLFAQHVFNTLSRQHAFATAYKLGFVGGIKTGESER